LFVREKENEIFSLFKPKLKDHQQMLVLTFNLYSTSQTIIQIAKKNTYA